MDPQLSAREPLGRIAEKKLSSRNLLNFCLSCFQHWLPVQADNVLARSVRGESEFAFTAVDLKTTKCYFCFSERCFQFTFERMILSSGSLISTCIPISGLECECIDFFQVVILNYQGKVQKLLGYYSLLAFSHLDGANPFVLGS